jgi:hypothetical protein
MTNTDNINFDAFSHGQIKSKIWLCDKLEPFLPKNANIGILGSWYNILSFMLLIRNKQSIKTISGIDHDPGVARIANKICDYWMIENNIVNNITEDAQKANLDSFNVVINCSSEHMQATDWFENISKQTLVCIQSSNITTPEEPWLITNPSNCIEDFSLKYPLEIVFLLDTLPIKYDTWGYERFMIIGIK